MGYWSPTDRYASREYTATPTSSALPQSCCRSSPKAPTNILILGATGTIGTYITRAIIDASDHFGRISIYTSAKTIYEKMRHIAGLESCGLEIYTGDLSDENAFKEALRDGEVDTIVSCVGRAAIEKQTPIITWAEQCGVRRFFTSEYGTDIEYDSTSQHEPPHQMKLAVRRHMKKCKRMEYTFLVTGPYSDLYLGPMREKPEIGSFDLRRRQACLLGTGNEPVSFTAMSDVGKFVVAALVHHAISRNTVLVVHSFVATPNEILNEFERQTKQEWDVHWTPLSHLKLLEKQAYQKRNPLATTVTLRRIWTEGSTLYKFYDDMMLGEIETQRLQDQVALSIKKQKAQVEEGQTNVIKKMSAL